MNIYCSILLLLVKGFLGGTTLSAQTNPTVDSLLAVLASEPHDTTRIDSYLSLHTECLAVDTTLSSEYLRQAIHLSEGIHDNIRICNSYLKLSNYLWKRGELPAAQQALTKVDQLRSSLKNLQIDAVYFTEQGAIFKNAGDYKAAAQSFLNANSAYEALQDTLGIAKCYNGIGSVYWEMEQLDDALDYYEKGLSLLKGTSFVASLSGILGNIGLIYRAKGDYDRALDYYTQSLDINKEYNNKLDEAIDLHNIGVLYTKKEDHHLALTYFKQASDLSESIGDRIGVLYANHAMAASYAKLGDFQKAIDNVHAAFPIAESLGVKEEIKNLHETLSNIYEKMGSFRLALEERKNFEQWKDSLINENHLATIKELEVQYETAKKNEEIALLTKERELQQAKMQQRVIVNQALLGGLLLVCTIGSLIVYLLRQKIKNQRLLSAKSEEIKSAYFKQQLSELEMKALRAQMNPHFIFNCLNSINRMVLGGEEKAASRYLTKFAKLIRLMLENSEHPTVSLGDELTMLEAYLQLESLRFKEKISYRITVDDTLDRETTRLPAMVLQPFIENAIWHGLMPKEGDGLIKISIQEEEGVLKCIIEDNGVGREQALALTQRHVPKKRSLGLQITEERLKLLSKERLKELIRITDLKDSMNRALGTRVDVLIPIS